MKSSIILIACFTIISAWQVKGFGKSMPLTIDTSKQYNISDSLSFSKLKGTVPVSFLKLSTNIDSAYYHTGIFTVDSFITVNSSYGVCILEMDDKKNCAYKFLLLCDLKKNFSPDYLIGQIDCDIDEGIGYYHNSYRIDMPFIFVTETYYAYVNNKYVAHSIKTNKYSVGSDGKFEIVK